MKIEIITKIGKNYGALLQAYALKTVFCSQGAECQVIRFELDSTQKTYRVCREPWRRRGILCNLQSIIHYKEYKESSNKCLEFRNQYYNLTRPYHTFDELCKTPPEGDIFVSGSDQVWNPRISFNPAYYCMFAKKGSKLASYAASIGVSKIDESIKNEFISRLSNFNYISVRESSAKELLEQFGIHADVAPDPTLLLTKDEWSDISANVVEDPYILCYFVAFPKEAPEIVKAIKKEIGIKVVNLMTSEDSSVIGDIKIRNAGPQEFLGLFKNATFVITSSFHGTVFSIINRKPFLSTLYSITGSRVADLLKSVSLEDRIYSQSATTYGLDYFRAANIYTDTVERQIKDLRSNGIRVIKKIMEENSER